MVPAFCLYVKIIRPFKAKVRAQAEFAKVERPKEQSSFSHLHP
ncbi:hypothetical protein NC99_03490 [Sunxiuqinia dokdonensis]|uniref:Uncharacterized protein n=1 Tax=Sunxiuqinia dokdonensis TaxID=1409788 RepID=A0A0L8VEC2_9BACT|nr:hypothetical protein NC99_03490 [Sunxiuqinia dokdonensis]